MDYKTPICSMNLSNESWSGRSRQTYEKPYQTGGRVIMFVRTGEGGEELKTGCESLTEKNQPIRVHGEVSQPVKDKVLKAPHGSGKTTSGNDNRKKFVFNGLTIDVEAANKQLGSGKIEVPRENNESITTHGYENSESNSLGFVKQFYQEQIDRLSSKNEQLLRENERLKIELKTAQIEAEEAESLRNRVVELERRVLKDFGNPSSSSPEKCGLYHSQSSVIQNIEDLSRETNSKKMRNNFNDKSKSPSNTSHEKYFHFTPDQYNSQLRKITSGNVSIEAKEQKDKDSSYLRDFITKLKQTGDLCKSASGHKKTSSLTGAMNKRKDVAGYYLGQAKITARTAQRNLGISSLHNNYSLQIKQEPKTLIYTSQFRDTNNLKNEIPPEQSRMNGDTRELPIEVVDFRKDRNPSETQIHTISLQKSGKSYQDYTQSILKKHSDKYSYKQTQLGPVKPI